MVAWNASMRCSLSEFLNLVELRGQTWCFLDLGAAGGIRIPRNDVVYFYAVLEGTATVAGVSGGTIELRAGEIVMVLSGEAHAVRSDTKSSTASIDFLISGTHADTVATFAVGDGRRATRLLAARLKVRWPGGQPPRSVASVLRSRADDDVVNFQKVLEKTSGNGAASLLTRAANLLFVSSLRDHPRCQAAFQEFELSDPISRAQQYIQTHPFAAWTVETLAHKVGMGRSNFATRFVKKVGRTPIEFVSEERMKHAAQLLERTDMKIAVIAERVGYHSEAAFIRRFTTSFGHTPGEIRKRHRATNDGSRTPAPVSAALLAAG